jgi:hypothetical protein
MTNLDSSAKLAVVPHTISDGQQFPIVCPVCKQIGGMPFMAGTTVESGAIRVGIRCRDCQHEWRFDMPVTVDSKRESGTRRVIS